MRTHLVLCIFLFLFQNSPLSTATNVSSNPEAELKNGTNVLQPYVVFIVNKLPDNHTALQVHCQSKDDDLGYRDLLVGEYFDWKFIMNFWRTTLFFCHFQWDAKETSFPVMSWSFAKNHCGLNPDNVNICWWEARIDGFYFGHWVKPKEQNLQKLRDW